MTRTLGRLAANVVLAAAGAAAAYVVFTAPPLKRLADRTARLWLSASVPSDLMEEAGRAWIEAQRSGPADNQV